MGERTRAVVKEILGIGVLAVLYYLSARALVTLSAPPNNVVVAVWLPSGLSVAAMVLLGPRVGIGAFIGSAVFELWTGAPPLGAMGMASVNVTSELAAYYLAGRHGHPWFEMGGLHDVFDLLFASITAAIISATLGVGYYLLAGVLESSDALASWVTMFGSVLMGILLVAPFIVYAVRGARSIRDWARTPDFAPAVSLLAVGSFLWQAAVLPSAEAREVALSFVVLMVIFAAFRFPPFKMSIAVMAFTVAAIAGTLQRISALPHEHTFASLFALQVIMCSVAVIAYFVSGMVTQQRRANNKLRLAAKVFESSREGIIITSADGTIVDVNDAYTRIHGHSREYMIGKNPRIVKSDKHPPEFYAQMWDELQKTGEWSGEVWDVRADGSYVPKLQSIAAVKDEQGNTSHYVGVFSDITKMKEAEDQLRHLATHDTLTGLPNRAFLVDTLSRAIPRARREGNKVALIFFDLDHFKNVNDTLGHQKGDELLAQVAQRTRSALRESDTVARIGGDEFTIVAPDVETRDVEGLVERLRAAIAAPYRLGADDAHVSPSIGIALYPEDGVDATTLIKHADVAMYRAKELGRNRYQFFSADLNAEFERRVRIEAGLRRALELGQFSLEYQPRVALDTGRIAAVEALLRWKTEDEFSVPPSEFVPIAEDAGLIIPIGEWVLRTACRDIAALRAAGFRDLMVSVNFSSRQFRELDTAGLIDDALRESGLPANALEVEVTESALMYNPEEASRKVAAIRALGVQISLDDFGTGYSSLKYVRLFNPDVLKLDRYFTHGLPGDRDCSAIALATIAMAGSLGMMTVAEGPESEEQVAFLQANGADYGQGYYFSAGLPLSELVQLLDRGPFALPGEKAISRTA